MAHCADLENLHYRVLSDGTARFVGAISSDEADFFYVIITCGY
jgi:hypothetical protein